jgi:hypothetical protein
MEQRIWNRICELVAARAAYEAEAKAQMMGFDAAIEELNALLAPQPQQDDPQTRSIARRVKRERRPTRM